MNGMEGAPPSWTARLAIRAVMLFWLALLAATPARADDDPTWYAGRLVASVELFAGDGALPDEDLEPLLRARQGKPLNPADMRLDLRTLYRVAPLAAVEAEVTAWPTLDPESGDVVDGVKVRYVVYPATRVSRVNIQGVRRVSARQVVAATRLAEGDVFDVEIDARRVGTRVEEWLIGQGFPQARVEVQAWAGDESDPYGLEVWVRVEEGEPRVLSELNVLGVPEQESARQLRGIVRRSGLRTGKPLADDAIGRARLGLRQELARVGTERQTDPLIGPRGRAFLQSLGVPIAAGGGWVDARIEVDVRAAAEGDEVTLTIIPGQRLVLRVEQPGGALPPALRGAVRDALKLDARLRLTRGYLEEAPETVQRALALRGYVDAKAAVTLEERQGNRVLRVAVQPGERHRRGPVQFVGNEALTDAQLRTLLNQASVDVLRRRRLTPQALNASLEAARQVYRSMGYEEARLTPGPPLVSRRWPGLSPDRSRNWIDVAVRVDEGPVTRLASIQVQGATTVFTNQDEQLARLSGTPFSPQRLQGISQLLVEAHRQNGWLDAQSRVRTRILEPGQIDATIEVTPGTQVLLRSFAARGNRRVSSRFLRKHLDLKLGDPITSGLLDDLRTRLYDLGMFSSLEVDLVGDDAARDLVVDLRERARHTLEGGLGLASDQGFRALGRWTWRNLLGPADRLDTNGLLGIRFASGGSVGGFLPVLRTPEYRLGSAYVSPLSRRSDFTLDLAGLEQIQERSWRLLRRGVSLGWAWRPHRLVRVQTAARFEHRRLADVDPGTLLPNDVWADPRLALPPDPSIDTRGRYVDNLEVVVLRDSRDNPLQPTRGVLLQGRAAFSPNLIQPAYARDLRVPTLAVEGRLSAALGQGATSVRFSAEGGHQQVLGLGPLPSFQVEGEPADPVVPVDQRYRLGGTASLRGFRRQAVGPLLETRQLDLGWPDAIAGPIAWGLADDDSRFVATGGDTFFRASADWLVPLPVLGLSDWDGYDLSVFVDVGQVWLFDTPQPSKLEQGPPLRVGTGVGMRVLTPVGPLQADIALNPQAAFARGDKGFTYRQQWREPPLRLHLSLGTLF
jgi:outer membrane protein assembly factor BamA